MLTASLRFKQMPLLWLWPFAEHITNQGRIFWWRCLMASVGGMNAAAAESSTTTSTTKTGYYRLCARPPPPPISMFNWPMMVVVVELLRKERRKNLSVKLTQPLTSISHYLSLNPFLNGWSWQKPHTNTQLSWGSLARWWIRQGVLFVWHIALAWQRVHRIVSVPLGRWRPGASLSWRTVISRCDRVMIALMTVHTHLLAHCHQRSTSQQQQQQN